MRWPLLAFIVIPMAELLLLFQVADLIGGLATLGLVIATAFIGVNVLRIQGFSTLGRASERMRSGQLPGQEIIEGMMLAFAGALLLTPGLITDTVGFALLTPPLRKRLAARVLRSGKGFFVGGTQGGSFGGGFSSYRSDNRTQGGDTVDGEIVDRDDHDDSRKLSDEPRDPR